MRRKPPTHSAPFYTTTQAADLLHVSPPTVVNWINSGLLHAHRTPGGHRRIAKEQLEAFAREHDYPLGGERPVQLPLKPVPRRTRVLVVDDNRDFLLTVTDYLEITGVFDLDVAHSGFAAGLAVARARPDVILLDIRMEGMDGFEVLKMLRSDSATRAIPVIACSEDHEPEVEKRALKEGFVHFLGKPFGMAHLQTVLERFAAMTPV